MSLSRGFLRHLYQNTLELKFDRNREKSLYIYNFYTDAGSPAFLFFFLNDLFNLLSCGNRIQSI